MNSVSLFKLNKSSGAMCGIISDEELLEIAVNNLSNLVIPTVKRDFYFVMHKCQANKLVKNEETPINSSFSEASK